jgi:tetratricopeptide (TPR) repeat protein
MLDRTRIIELIKYPSSATTEEQEELLTLSRQYTYSALLKILNAKIASIRQSADTNQFLTSAAITAVDRANLKKYIQTEVWEVSTFVPELVKNTEVTEEKSAPETESEQPSFQEEEVFLEETQHVQETEEPENNEPDTPVGETEISEPIHSPEMSGRNDKDEEAILHEQPGDQDDEGPAEDWKTEPGDDQAQETIPAVSDEDEDSDAVLPQQEEFAPEDTGDSADGVVSLDQEHSEPADTINEPLDLSEKEFKPVSSEHGNKPEVLDPLSSDLMNNIREYRKSRDFFEKLLKDDDHEESAKISVEGKKKSDKKGGKKTGKKSGKAEHTDPEDPQLKKNAEKAEKPVNRETGRDSSSEEKDAGEKSESSPESIPTEPIEKDVIEKVTEERKSEGYQVYEEEDPGVIREFLDKITGESENLKKLKKEEQVEIIENFIKTDPRIKNVKSHKTLKEREDLSLPSVKFKDDIVSENLANIMISQGKTEQAIDIYKKLIWKFPQKKAYFATQIEELKKK